MAWKVEVIADETGEFISNNLVFATQAEADDYGRQLAYRWTAVKDWRSTETNAEVNCVFSSGHTTFIKGEHNDLPKKDTE